MRLFSGGGEQEAEAAVEAIIGAAVTATGKGVAGGAIVDAAANATVDAVVVVDSFADVTKEADTTEMGATNGVFVTAVAAATAATGGAVKDADGTGAAVVDGLVTNELDVGAGTADFSISIVETKDVDLTGESDIFVDLTEEDLTGDECGEA